MQTKIYLFLFLIIGGFNLSAQEQKMTDAEIASFKQDVNVVAKKSKL